MVKANAKPETQHEVQSEEHGLEIKRTRIRTSVKAGTAPCNYSVLACYKSSGCSRSAV